MSRRPTPTYKGETDDTTTPCSALPALQRLSLSKKQQVTDAFHILPRDGFTNDLESILRTSQGNSKYPVVSPLSHSQVLKNMYLEAMTGSSDKGVFCVKDGKIVCDESLQQTMESLLTGWTKSRFTAGSKGGEGVSNSGYPMPLPEDIGSELRSGTRVFVKKSKGAYDKSLIDERDDKVISIYDRFSKFLQGAEGSNPPPFGYRMKRVMFEEKIFLFQRQVVQELLALDFSLGKEGIVESTLPNAFCVFKGHTGIPQMDKEYRTPTTLSVSKEARPLDEYLFAKRTKFSEVECTRLANKIIDAALNIGLRGFALCDFKMPNILLSRDEATGELSVWPIDFDPAFTWQIDERVPNREYIATIISMHVFYVHAYRYANSHDTQELEALICATSLVKPFPKAELQILTKKLEKLKREPNYNAQVAALLYSMFKRMEQMILRVNPDLATDRRRIFLLGDTTEMNLNPLINVFNFTTNVYARESFAEPRRGMNILQTMYRCYCRYEKDVSDIFDTSSTPCQPKRQKT